MKKLAFVSLLVVAAISPFLSFGAECVYLKPLGASEERTTQDGESWATAYADPATAIAAAASAGKPVYAAQGVYVISTLIEMPASGVAIYGGFEGVRDDETVEGRDWDKYETIFSGDTQGNDVWVHVQPNLMQYVATTRTATTEPVIKDGRVNLPAYTGDYDTYETSHDYDCNRCFHFGSGVGGTVDGIWITSFQRSGHDGAGMLIESGGDISVRNCRFVGCCGSMGTIKVSAATNAKIAIEDCKFINNSTYSRTAGIVAQAKDLQLKGCEFIGYTQQADSQSPSGLAVQLKSTGITLTDCTFARGYAFSATGSNEISTAGGLAIVVSAEDNNTGAFYDCVFTNNLAISTVAAHNATAAGAPLFNARNCDFAGCHIANNRQEITVKAGYSYNMFRGSEQKDARQVIERCSFVSNTVYAVVAADSDAGQYAVGILGNHQSRSQHFALVNDTFMDNQIIAAETETVKALKCRGVLVTSTAAGIQPSFGLANCTFHGAAAKGVYDLAQFGSAQTKTMNVVNCLFESGADADYEPFSFTVPSVVKLYSTSVKNNLVPVEGVVTNDYQSDEVPFAPLTVAEGYVAGTLTPIAAPPGIRHSADFARNAATATIGNSLFSFKPAGSASWIAFDPALSGTAASAGGLITDANGAERPAGSFTRGAVQPLGGAAEGGVTLTIRRDPIAAGSLNGPAVQSVAVGGTVTPVTVVPGAGKAVEGWYEEGSETPIPTDTPEKLPLATLSKDTILTVRFTVPQVKVTFDLGEHGHFNAAGNPSKVEVLSTPGKEFPAVPEFTIDEAWHMVSWDKSFPLLTPETDESFTAKYVTKDVRIVYATPEGAGKKDGTSWENAYAGVAAAYADAGLYRGEVWLKGGFYPIANVIQWKNNVTVRGGFAGNETTADAADPKLNQTILTGDVKGDDYWLPDGVNQGQAGYEVWTQDDKGELVFNEPNPDCANKYWKPSGNNSDDAASAFVNTSGYATNVCFEGLVFTGFKSSAIASSSGQANGLRIAHCRFLACDTGVGSDYAFNINGSSFVVEDCEFNGCWAAAYFTAPAATTGVFVNTAFKNCAKDAWGTAALKADGRAVIAATNCWFYRGWVSEEHQQAASAFTTAASGGLHQFYKCTFEENYSTGHARGTVVIQGDSGICFDKCRFLRNRNENTDAYADLHSACIAYGQSKSPDSFCRDCFFEGNYASSTANGTANYVSSILSARGAVTFSNCTILNSTNDISGADCPAGTFALRGASIGLVNCVVKDTANLTANSADITVTSAPSVGIINSVLTSKEPNYRALRPLDSTLPPTMANSYLQDFEVATCAGTQNAYFYGVVTNGDPCVKGKVEEKDGVLALGVGAGCKVRMRPVWLANDNTAWIFDPVASSALPWRKVTQRTLFKRESEVVSLGLDKQNPVLPDAFGASRKIRKDGLGRVPGPLEGDAPGLVIILR